MPPGAGLTRNQLLLMVAGFGPVLVLFFLNLWGRPHYQFFPLALAGAGFLAWTRSQAMPQPLAPGNPWIIALVLGTSGLLLGTAGMLWTPWLGSIAAFLMLAGVIWWLGGAAGLRAYLPALLLTLTIIPPPLKLDTELTMHLRSLAVICSGRLLDLLGVVQHTGGNVIEVPGHRLLVEEACSGINSVLFMLATCLFYTLWKRRRPVRILVCLTLTVGFVVMGNIFRITVGGWLQYKFHVDLLTGWPHEVLGLVLVVTYLGLIFSLDRLLTFLLLPATASVKPVIAPTPPVPKATVRIAPRWGQVAAVSFLVVGLAGAAVGWKRHQGALSLTAKSALRAGAAFTMPEKLLEWQRLSRDVATGHTIETTGISSHQWQFQKGNLQVTLGLDYPFSGCHDVGVCYIKSGWKFSQQRQRDAMGTDKLPIVEVQMTKDGVQHGYLLHGTVDEQGHWLQLPGFGDGNLKSRFATVKGTEPTTYRVQLLAVRYVALSPEERQQVEAFYEAARRVMWQQLASQLQP